MTVTSKPIGEKFGSFDIAYPRMRSVWQRLASYSYDA
jgi:hypothetical protein